MSHTRADMSHVSVDLTDHFRKMALALFVAYKALAINETPVACILVDDATGQVVSIGYNDTNRSLNGTRHGEFIAIDTLLAQHGDSNSSITVYVTVEPCIMCAAALRQIARIKTVVFGCGNERFGGNGTVLAVQGESYASFPGVLRVEAIQLLRNFYVQENESAPDPQIKKNKELKNKEYPPMDVLSYVGEEAFKRFYGGARLAQNNEITPVQGSGYSMKELISLSLVLALPGLEEMYSRERAVGEDKFEARVKADLEAFCSLFYEVGGNGEINWDSNIRVFQEIRDIHREEEEDQEDKKRRKLST